MSVITSFYVFPRFNAVTPSSAEAIAATTLARPADGNIVQMFTPADATDELVGDVQWIVQISPSR